MDPETPTPTPTNPDPDTLEKPVQAPEPAPDSRAPVQAPPAAETVLEGTRTEKELTLERNIKERERRIAELEDENHQLKTPPSMPARPAPEKKSWLKGATFFD